LAATYIFNARLAFSTNAGGIFVERTPQVGSWSFVVAGVIVVLLYAANLIYCQHSVLQLLDAGASDSDMHANLMWAKGIREQGWLNPRPYHPWTNWM